MLVFFAFFVYISLTNYENTPSYIFIDIYTVTLNIFKLKYRSEKMCFKIDFNLYFFQI